MLFVKMTKIVCTCQYEEFHPFCYIHFGQFEILRFKLLKYEENNKKICNTFDHNFKIIPSYMMRKVSLERYYFVLYDGALTLKFFFMALNPFCDKTLHMFVFSQSNLKPVNFSAVVFKIQYNR